MGVELKEIGPGPVGTRLPVDPNVGIVAFDSGKGADELLIPIDCPIGLLDGDPVEMGVEIDDKLTEPVGGMNVPGFEAPVGPVVGNVELVKGKGIV